MLSRTFGLNKLICAFATTHTININLSLRRTVSSLTTVPEKFFVASAWIRTRDLRLRSRNWTWTNDPHAYVFCETSSNWDIRDTILFQWIILYWDRRADLCSTPQYFVGWGRFELPKPKQMIYSHSPLTAREPSNKNNFRLRLDSNQRFVTHCKLVWLCGFRVSTCFFFPRPRIRPLCHQV